MGQKCLRTSTYLSICPANANRWVSSTPVADARVCRKVIKRYTMVSHSVSSLCGVYQSRGFNKHLMEVCLRMPNDSAHDPMQCRCSPLSLAWANRSIVPEEGVRMFVERQQAYQPALRPHCREVSAAACNMQRSAECKLRTESLGLFTQLRSVIPSYLILFYCCIPFADQARFVVFVYTILLLCTHGLASHLTYLRVVWMPTYISTHSPSPP